MDRKEFLKACSLTCLGGASVSMLMQGCASSNYFAQHSVEVNRILINKSEFEIVKKDKVMRRTYILIKNSQLEFPICIYRFNDNEFTALYLKCTHQGCEVQPQGDFLVCPCHGSEYSNQGKVTNPPAEHDLIKYEVRTDAESISIQL